MSQGTGCSNGTPIKEPALTVTGSVNALEGQANALHSMLNNLERLLYGEDNAVKCSDGAQKPIDGFEERLSDVVSINERALSKLDHIISRL